MVDFIRYLPHSNISMNKLIDCYREVFAEDPWNEWLKCQICGKHFGIKQKENLLRFGSFIHCGVPLVEFWPKEKVAKDILSEITEEASCHLAINKEKNVVGFCWGYPIDITQLEEKIGIKFAEEIKKRFNNCHRTICWLSR